jgi:hypothetical protein
MEVLRKRLPVLVKSIKMKRGDCKKMAKDGKEKIGGDAGISKTKYLGSVKFFRHVILSVVALAIAVPTTIAIILALGGGNPGFQLTGETINGRGVLVTPDNIDEILARQQEKVADGYYTVNQNGEWRFDTWDTPSSNAVVRNDPQNTRTVYFDLVLDSTNELVYSSPFMPLGSELQGFALDKHVPAGTHSATMTYHLVDDEYKNITELSVAVRLVISN